MPRIYYVLTRSDFPLVQDIGDHSFRVGEPLIESELSAIQEALPVNDEKSLTVRKTKITFIPTKAGIQ